MEGGKESVIEKNRRKSFFDCEEDLQATSRDDFAVAQAKASKLMDFVWKEIAGNPATNFHMNDGLYVVRDKENPTLERDAVVVPENLRAWLHMHHNIELAGHQGHKRMIDQIGCEQRHMGEELLSVQETEDGETDEVRSDSTGFFSRP